MPWPSPAGSVNQGKATEASLPSLSLALSVFATPTLLGHIMNILSFVLKKHDSVKHLLQELKRNSQDNSTNKIIITSLDHRREMVAL